MTATRTSTGDQAPGLGFLPCIPLQPSWVEEHPAFLRPAALEGRLLAGVWRLLFASWRGIPAASIPSSQSFLSACAGLSPDEVAEHYRDLTYGYELRADGRLHHVGLSALTLSMLDLHGKEISAIQMSMAMVAQDPEQFSLVAPEAAAGRKPRGKHGLPKVFGFEQHPDLRDWLTAEGWPDRGHQDWFMQSFKDFATSRDERAKDWPATFRNWHRKAIQFKQLPPGCGNAVIASGGRAAEQRGSPFANLAGAARQPVSRGEQIAERNSNVFADMERRLQQGQAERAGAAAA